jgi:hypothetical protein
MSVNWVTSLIHSKLKKFRLALADLWIAREANPCYGAHFEFGGRATSRAWTMGACVLVLAAGCIAQEHEHAFSATSRRLALKCAEYYKLMLTPRSRLVSNLCRLSPGSAVRQSRREAS